MRNPRYFTKYLLKSKLYIVFRLTTVGLILSTIAIDVAASEISELQWRTVTQLSGTPSTTDIDVPAVYIFFDPNCPATAKLFRNDADGKSFADAPAVWIPVAYMKADSLGKAAATLREMQFSAIKDNFTHYDSQEKSGAITPVQASAKERSEVANAKRVWMELTTTPATPMIVYKDNSGAPHVHLGYNSPEKLKQIVREAPSSHIPAYK